MIVEEFTPGREVRAGCVADSDGDCNVMSCKIEYIMNKYPIRREEDKITKEKSDGEEDEVNLVQTKCEREYLIPGKENSNVSPPPHETLLMIDIAVVKGHKALGCRDYSLFDFRIHEKNRSTLHN